jgi:hypothetical protein
MHGVVLWNSKSLINFNGESFDKIDCSRLITWMDGRCSTEFLAGLPKYFFEKLNCNFFIFFLFKVVIKRKRFLGGAITRNKVGRK